MKVSSRILCGGFDLAAGTVIVSQQMVTTVSWVRSMGIQLSVVLLIVWLGSCGCSCGVARARSRLLVLGKECNEGVPWDVNISRNNVKTNQQTDDEKSTTPCPNIRS